MTKLTEPVQPASTEIEAMTDAEVMAELSHLTKGFTDADYDRLEDQLRLRAAVLGWTGDPLKQPAGSVLASARAVVAEKGGAS